MATATVGSRNNFPTQPRITRRGSAATEGETADNADAADIMNETKETWRSKPQIDTDETQIGKECFF